MCRLIDIDRETGSFAVVEESYCRKLDILIAAKPTFSAAKSRRSLSAHPFAHLPKQTPTILYLPQFSQILYFSFAGFTATWFAGLLGYIADPKADC